MRTWRKMPSRKLLVLAGAVSALGLGLLFWAYPSAVPDAAHDARVEASETRWPGGEQRNYSVRLDSRVRFEQPDIMVVTVAGTLDMTRVSSEQLELAAALEVSSVSLGVQASPEEEAAVRRGLGEPFSVRFGPGGRVAEIGFPPV